MSEVSTDPPGVAGFRMPAEWEPHAGTWMLWPFRPDVWRDAAGPGRAAFAAVAAAIAAAEPVTVAARPGDVAGARALLGDAIRVVALDQNDAWARDTGPTVLVRDADGARCGADWQFNAWGGASGGLYDDWSADAAVAAAICATEGIDRHVAPFVLEGGSICSDGAGTILTTEQCLLHPNRNPDLTKAEIEANLCAWLGAERVVWLGEGVVDDETDGHIDDLAVFVAPGVVALHSTDDRADPQYARSADARRRLGAAGLEVVALPMPGPLHLTPGEAAGIAALPGAKPRRAGDRLAASYVNFAFTNESVIVPVFGTATDDAALDALGAAVAASGRTVVPVAGRELVLGGGNVHCITQQIPASSGASG